MAYPLSHSDFPPFAELSLNDSQRSKSRWPTSHLQSTPDTKVFSFQPYTAEQKNLVSPPQHLSRWSVPGWQSSLDFGSDMIPPLQSNTENMHSSWGTPYHPKATMESLFLPRLSLPDLSDCEFLPLSAAPQTCCLTLAVRSPFIAYRYMLVRLFGCFCVITAPIYPCHLQYSCCCTPTTPLSLPYISPVRPARCRRRSLPSALRKESTEAEAGIR